MHSEIIDRQVLIAACEFHLWKFLLYWASLRILHLGICRSISTWYVKPSLQSVEEPRDSWETEHCVNFLCRGALPSYCHWSMRRVLKMTNGCYQIFRLDQGGIHDCLFMKRPFCPTPLSPVMRDWSGVIASIHEAVIKSHRITCHIWPVWTQFLLKSVIHSTEFLSVVWKRARKRQIVSTAQFPFSFCISISLTPILTLLPSLAVTVSLHVGRDC